MFLPEGQRLGEEKVPHARDLMMKWSQKDGNIRERHQVARELEFQLTKRFLKDGGKTAPRKRSRN